MLINVSVFSKIDITFSFGIITIPSISADIDGIVIIPKENVISILEKTETLINTESMVRKAIREGMDPQEAYLKYGAF